MPFSFFRPDGPPRRPGSNGSFSSFTTSSSSSSPNYTRHPALASSLNVSYCPPLNNSPPQSTFPCDRKQERPNIVNLRTAGTPPRSLTFLPTPPDSVTRSLLKNTDQEQPMDGNASFFTPATIKTVNPALHDLRPETLQSLCQTRESSYILHVTSSEFADWEARYPGIDESNIRYQYDGLMERMIINCMAGPVHDSFPIYFFRAIGDQAGPQCRRGLQMCTSTG